MADLELFEKILIAEDIRGGRGDKGEKGEQGPTADVTGQALYAASVEQGFPGTYDDWLREYLGAAVQTSLPWCTGSIQNRSFEANIPSLITPIVTAGDSSIIDGSELVIPSGGLYYAGFTGGNLLTSAEMFAIIAKNVDFSTVNSAWSNRIQVERGSSAWLSGISVILDFEAGDHISFWVMISSTCSGWGTTNLPMPYFSLCKLYDVS